MRFLIVIGLLGGCGLEDDENLECKCLSYEVTSMTNFDRLIVLLSGRQDSTGPAPRTPAMLAAGESAPTSFELEQGGVYSDRTFTPSVSSAEIDHADPWTGAYGVLAVGYDHDAILGADYARLDYVNQVDSYDIAEGSLELDPTFATEVWGAQGVDSNGFPLSACVRIVKPGLARYFVRRLDRDCDAILDADDCKPTEYCDPAATSPAGIAACSCT